MVLLALRRFLFGADVSLLPLRLGATLFVHLSQIQRALAPIFASSRGGPATFRLRRRASLPAKSSAVAVLSSPSFFPLQFGLAIPPCLSLFTFIGFSSPALLLKLYR